MDDRPVEEVLDTIGDQRTRQILAELSREPQSAKELADVLDYSLATIYRRLEDLQDQDLIVDQTLVADDGNHYKMYECAFDSTIISLEDDEYEVRIFRKENLPDRFSRLWDELSRRE